MSTAAEPPIYFETSWSILSSVGLYNVFVGFLVVGITNLSPITVVPIVVSAACAIADGLCYYAFYANYSVTQTAVAAAFADFFWLIQEAGLSFYSYEILIRVLRGRDRRTFMILFWIMIVIITAFRCAICVSRVQDIIQNSTSRTDFIDHMHIGYFTSIALVEMLSSYFLLRKFFSAKSGSVEVSSRIGLFKYLTRSTEIRLAVLTLIGITRAITYSFQTTAQSATSISGQVDRFVTTLECLFPIVMFIDILAAKSLVRGDHKQYSTSQTKSKRSYAGTGATQGVYAMTNMETRVDANMVSSSQERIVGTGSRGPAEEFYEGEAKTGGINKTVEFVIHDSESAVAEGGYIVHCDWFDRARKRPQAAAGVSFRPPRRLTLLLLPKTQFSCNKLNLLYTEHQGLRQASSMFCALPVLLSYTSEEFAGSLPLTTKGATTSIQPRGGWALQSHLMSPYKYKRLVSGEEIRLLRLLPGQFSDDIEVEIFVERFKAKKPPRYEALSYVWGSTNDLRIIKLRHGSRESAYRFLSIPQRFGFRRKDTTTLAVTQNLEVALRHLRLPEKTRVFWIDAICISQDDSAERSAEVGRMGNIFEKASQVVVWLGPESQDSNLAIDTLQRIGQDVVYDANNNIIRSGHGTEAAHLVADHQAMNAKHANWVAIKNLLERDWFERLWVVQEIILAAEAVMTIGFESMPWPIFYNAFQWFWTYAEPLVDECKDLDFRLLTLVIGKDRFNCNTVDLIEVTKNSFCAEPKDRVYALLSLMEEATRLSIVPDYRLSPEEVYKDFTLCYIKATANLNILRLCTMGGRGLPSWVPDLSNPCPTMFFQHCLASGTSSHEFRTSVDSTLSIQGVHSSTIACIGDTVLQGTKPPDISAFCHNWESSNASTTAYKYGDAIADAYLSTLVGGFTKGALPSRAASAPSIEDCRSFFNDYLGRQQIDGLAKGQYKCLIQIRRYLPGRRLFTTKNGYIGLCPADAKCGDHICVVLGCSTPLLLRPMPSQDGHYQLVGDCYIHGLMHNEGLLGPLPSLWTCGVSQGYRPDFDIWEHKSDGKSHEDPRLGPLPSGWKRNCLEQEEKETDQAFDRHGNPHRSYFENMETGIMTAGDPRLTAAALRARGVDIKEFILV